MAEMEDLIVQYNIENNPSYTMNMALFTDVTNSNELRQLIVQGKLEAALLNACMVLFILLLILYYFSCTSVLLRTCARNFLLDRFFLNFYRG